MNIILFIFLVIVAIAIIVFFKFYRKTSKEICFVRTGFGGEKVVKGGGAIVIPFLQNITEVNLNTLRLPVHCSKTKAVITKDRIRVDVVVDFYVRVALDKSSISIAAATLGSRTLDPEALRNIVEGKFIDAISSIAAETTIQELHENRKSFSARIHDFLLADLSKNGLELESVSITSLDQSSMEYFNSANIFDAEGLTRLTETIENRKKKRNDIEQDTQIQIKNKNLETEKLNLAIEQEINFARLDQERDVEFHKAEQNAKIAKKRVAEEQAIDEVAIAKQRAIDMAKIVSDQKIEEIKISKEKSLQEVELNKKKDLALLEQQHDQLVYDGSIARMKAKGAADEIRAQLVSKEEKVISAQEIEIAERKKAISIIEAIKIAEQQAMQNKIVAQSEKTVAQEKAAAENIKVKSDEVRYKVEAEGQRILNEARNILSETHLQGELRKYLIDHLAEIIQASSEPLKNIDSVKVVQTSGFTGVDQEKSNSSNIFDAALRYRAQAPIIDNILNELGLSRDGTINEKNLNGKNLNEKNQDK